MTHPLTVLVASDGSSSARAAVSLAGQLPWPDDTRAIAVVAGATPQAIGLGLYRDAVMQGYRSEAQRLEVFLRDRFSESRVALAGKPPVDAILAEQRRRRAHVIVVGRRGLGALGRLALGSVSHRIVQEAPCAVLVAKRASHAVRRFVIAVDGSAASLRGVRFIERLKASTGGRVRLVEVVPPIPLPLMGRVPASVRSDVRRHVAREQTKRDAAARRHLDNAAKRLRTAGWNVTTDVRRGPPVVEILKAVADGLLSRSPVSILNAR
jgi:nucleotide-binding universal stress UspA family protein